MADALEACRVVMAKPTITAIRRVVFIRYPFQRVLSVSQKRLSKEIMLFFKDAALVLEQALQVALPRNAVEAVPAQRAA